MRQFTIRLYEDADLPLMSLDNWHRLDAMLDTGSRFSVWTAEESLLQEFGAKLKIRDAEFGGFGGKAKGNVYEIPSFQFGDLIYPNMNIIASQLEVPCHIIISATMLKGMCYEIDDANHALTVTIPDNESNVRNLKIHDKDGKLYVLSQSA